MKLILIPVLIFFYGSELFSQPKKDVTDVFTPLSKISLGNGFYMDWQEFKDDRFYNITFLSGDLKLNKNFYASTNINYVTTDVTFSTTSGIGDLPVLTRYTGFINSDTKFLSGLIIIFPTAKLDETGTGKFICAPEFGLNKYFKSGYYGFLLKDFFSFAGDGDRKDFHELSFNPMLKVDLGKSWYTLITPDIKYNWITGRIFLPYTQEFGKIFGNKFATALKAGGHILNRDKRYDWSVELRFTLY